MATVRSDGDRSHRWIKTTVVFGFILNIYNVPFRLGPDDKGCIRKKNILEKFVIGRI